MTQRFKKPTDSDTAITELMIPAYANFGGKIHGGILLSLMDKVAYACATKHSEEYCVTVAVDNVNFLQPVEVGELVHMMARVNFTGRTSMVVGIKVTAENVKERRVKHTNNSYFTMVAKGEDGSPLAVPGLQLTDEESLRRFAEAKLRRERIAEHRDLMRRMSESFDVERAKKAIASSNCTVAIAAN
ncbi:MAG: acyl-CoA thioesterase [Myxococcota bacterium]